MDTARPAGTSRPTSSTGPERDDPEVEEATKRVLGVAAETWYGLAHWAKETNNLAPWQRGLSFSLGKVVGQSKKPSPKQAIQGVRILDEARRRGFQVE